jgi:WD40 repeat protein
VLGGAGPLSLGVRRREAGVPSVAGAVRASPLPLIGSGSSKDREDVMRHRRALWALLGYATLLGPTRAEEPARLLSSWQERDVRVVAFSPDGSALVSSGREETRLRDAVTGKVRAVLNDPPMNLVRKTAFSPDGRLLFAQVASDRARPLIVHDLKVWEVATGERRGSFEYVAEHLDEGSFELSPDGRRLAFVDNSGRLPLDVATSKITFERGREATIARNASPELPRLKLWDVAAWREIAMVNGGMPLAFSPDGATLATGDRDWRTPVARLWDARTGERLSELERPSPGSWPLVFSPDGRFLASGEHAEKSLWHMADGRRWALAVEGTGLNSRQPAFSPDGKLFFPKGLPWMNPSIGQPEEYACFDISEMPPTRLDLGSGQLIISPDGRRYAAVQERDGSGNPRRLVMFDLPARREVFEMVVSGQVGGRFSPDGGVLALLTVRSMPEADNAKAPSHWGIHLIDPATGTERATVPLFGDTWGNHGWTFSPDGNRLAVYYRTGSNVSGPGDPDPSDRPMTIDVWDLTPR